MPQCRCGKQIFFGKTMDGKVIPLDSEAPVYRDISNPNEPMNGDIFVEREKKAFALHSGCGHSSDMTRRKVSSQNG